MVYGKSISPEFQNRLAETRKQNRLLDPNSPKEAYIEQLNELKDELASILGELRIYMARLYGIDSLISRSEHIEDELTRIEVAFHNAFKTEMIEDGKQSVQSSGNSKLISDGL